MSHEESRNAATWAWATEHGAPEWASTEQLVVWLGRGELPPHTLVWKQGWGEWLPAMQVAELAAAFPRVTAGSRRVARAVAGNAVTPPPVPIAHYPRLRLLAKDVLSESPLPPGAAPSAAGPLAMVPAGRRALRDPDRLQHDVATSQVPAAAMLEAARAMKERGAHAPPSSAERWAQLQLGRFGEPPPAAPAMQQVAERVVLPASEPHAAARSRRSRAGYSAWLWLGALVGGSLGLLSVSWPAPGGLLARAAVSLLELRAVKEAVPESSRRIETHLLSLETHREASSENACLAAEGEAASQALDEATPSLPPPAPRRSPPDSPHASARSQAPGLDL